MTKVSTHLDAALRKSVAAVDAADERLEAIDPLADLAPLIRAISQSMGLASRESGYLYFLEALLDSLPVPTYVKDARGFYRCCNRAFAEKILHCGKAALIGKSAEDFFDVFSKAGVDLIQQKDRELQENPGAQQFELSVPAADGQLRDYALHRTSLCDSTGQPVGAVGIMTDITERNRALRELKKLSQAVEHSPSSVVITDREGHIEYVNPVFSEVSGYSFAEALGQNPRILKSGGLSTEFYRNLWETILAGKIWRGDLINRKKNGEEYWEEASIAPILNENGVIAHFVAVKHDITERKRTERELISALQAAEVANRAKSNFLSSMSHELRTPLNAVIGFAEVLQEQFFGPLNDKQLEYVHHIFDSGKRLLALINDILDLSKMEAGTLELEPALVALPDLLRASLEMVKERASRHAIELKLTLSPNLENLQLIADGRKIKQAMLHLLSNAVKFTPDGGWIEVSASREQGDELHICVADSGIGIAADDQQRLLDEFCQNGASRQARASGSGLGLPLSKKIVQLHGGRIWIASQGAGHGSQFHFAIPLDSTRRQPAEALSGAAHADLRPGTTFKEHLESLLKLNSGQRQAMSLVQLRFDAPMEPAPLEALRASILDRKRRNDEFWPDVERQSLFMLLQDTDARGSAIFCERIRSAIAPRITGATPACAIASYPQDGENAEQLLARLDQCIEAHSGGSPCSCGCNLTATGCSSANM